MNKRCYLLFSSIVLSFFIFISYEMLTDGSIAYSKEVGGLITTDEIFTFDESPYEVTSSLVVNEGVIVRVNDDIQAKVVGANTRFIGNGDDTTTDNPTVIDVIVLNDIPSGIAVNPTTNRVYVVHGFQDSLELPVSVVDGSTNEVVDVVMVENNPGIIPGRPIGIGVNIDSNLIYVVSDGGVVSVIDGKSNQVINTIRLENDAENLSSVIGDGVAVNPKTNTIYVANAKFSLVSVIDGLTNQIVDSISIDGNPMTIAINSSTNTIYVDRRDGLISVIDGESNQIVDLIPVDSPTGGIALSTETNRIYVAGSQSGTISVIDGLTNQVVETIHSSAISQQGIVVNPSTNRVFVTNTDFNANNTVNVIDMATNIITETLEVEQSPRGIAVNPSTNFIYVLNDRSSTISVIKDGSLPASTPSVEPSPTPDLSPTISSITLNHLELFRSFKSSSVIVTVRDKNDLPIKDIEIITIVEADGLIKPKVKPDSGFTNDQGEADFEVKFPLGSKNGSITFKAETISVTLLQK